MTINGDAIVIREIKLLSEMREVEQLQRDVWGVADLDVFPALALRPMIEVGSILLGAFLDNKLVGFVFGFPGFEGNQRIIHSDMLAVKKDYRSMRLGRKLKLAQRECALAMGVEKITWTFDPLQPRNAHLNFARLGVIADRYEVNFYGETSSFLHRLGTDRLWVSWFLQSPRVRNRIAGIASKDIGDVPALIQNGPDNRPIKSTEAAGASVRIEVPNREVLDSDEALALEWREVTRKAFSDLIGVGYVVEDFVRASETGTGSYLLTQK